MADAAVMAITEAHQPYKKDTIVHAWGIQKVVIPAHQKHLAAVYGTEIPEYAIDID